MPDLEQCLTNCQLAYFAASRAATTAMKSAIANCGENQTCINQKLADHAAAQQAALDDYLVCVNHCVNG
jgi:hypothetical protein